MRDILGTWSSRRKSPQADAQAFVQKHQSGVEMVICILSNMDFLSVLPFDPRIQSDQATLSYIT